MDSIDFFTRSGQLWARNSIATEPFRIKGVNWFGFESPSACVDGVWQRPMHGARLRPTPRLHTAA